MNAIARNGAQPDQPLVDTTPYGYGPGDSVSDVTENAAITHHTLKLNGKSIAYTARAGHLVTTDAYSARPAAKLFFVAFTVDDAAPSTRPVTFFYNGGPGSSSVFLLLGSFGPRRIKTSMPSFTPPAPYALEDNPDSLLDQSDLVFIDPVGTGYSTAIEPNVNKDFWGVDQDAGCIKQFIKRYLTVFDRWNSPKYLFGESYGTPRTAVLTWMLHEDGVDLNGVVLQSSILDYSQQSNPPGLLPTLAADAWFHKKVTVSPVPHDLPGFMDKVEKFANGPYANALDTFPKVDPEVLQHLSDILGIPPVVLRYWRLDPSAGNGSTFLTSLLLDAGLAVGLYDGRVTGKDTGIAGNISPNSGGNDPTISAVGGVYTAMWNVYLNDELQYTSISPFMDLNDQAFANWDFSHVDPTGAEKGGIASLYTAGDLAAAMAVNPYLRVFSANGYYDAVTPFFQTKLTFESMPLDNAQIVSNLTIRNYPSGHMIYLDNASRTAMKADLSSFYGDAHAHVEVIKAAIQPERKATTGVARYRRRSTRTPY
ncbi:S10 family peptidase [Burkholderia ubonensis]|uniref:Peptidase S1 n=1 Tax=Burkholderia ubonensis subsp. mesacidophila TaxID=265293 RepID=A0A2A4EV92_9BURK|nr:peptidase S1 [Burkholderia ubonensis]PCE24765.1 peptidase S1 [Burkholderia ubonensis subsp. mesacidophila]